MIQTEYEVIEASSRQALVKAVNTKLDEGWALLGGVAIAIDPGSSFPMMYCQAMARDRVTIDDNLVERVDELVGAE